MLLHLRRCELTAVVVCRRDWRTSGVTSKSEMRVSEKKRVEVYLCSMV